LVAFEDFDPYFASLDVLALAYFAAVLGVVDEYAVFIDGMTPALFAGAVQMGVSDWDYVRAGRVHGRMCFFIWDSTAQKNEQ
jgi:hypothetical protein